MASMCDSKDRITHLIPRGADITKRDHQENEVNQWNDELRRRVEGHGWELVASQIGLLVLASELTLAEARAAGP